MKKMYNLTLHPQDEYIQDFKKFGFEIDPSPRLSTLALHMVTDNSEQVLTCAKQTVDALPSDAEAVLIGGLTDLFIYIERILREKRPEVKIYVCATQRIRENDKFVFKFGKLREVLHLKKGEKIEKIG